MMKTALLGLFCLQTALALTPFQALVEEWETWKMEHGKNYSNNSEATGGLGEFSQEESFRMKVWIENKAIIQRHNRQFYKGVHSYKLAMNEFGDLLGHEFVSTMNGYRARQEERLNGSRYLLPANTESLPRSVDWRQEGAVTPVKDQGQCGSCWAFSTTGALEAMHHRATGHLVSLSEQQLLDCSRAYGTHGCHGGWMDNAFKYIKDQGGIDTEDSYPYEAQEDRKCRYNPSDSGATDVGFIDVTSGDENALKSAIATQGPCSVAIDASQKTFMFYQSGIYSDQGCGSDPQSLDHAVLVVGYGEDGGRDYWLIKNSWGTGWGEGGYVRMARNEDNMCGVATAPSFPLV